MNLRCPQSPVRNGFCFNSTGPTSPELQAHMTSEHKTWVFQATEKASDGTWEDSGLIYDGPNVTNQKSPCQDGTRFHLTTLNSEDKELYV